MGVVMGQKPRPLDPNASPLAFFGFLLRDWRVRRGLSQARLGLMVHVSRDLIAKIEKAERRPSRDLIDRLDAALDADGELSALAGSVRTPDRDGTASVLPGLVGSGPLGLAAGREVVVGLREVLGGLRRLDHSLGSGAVLASVLAQARVAEDMLATSRGRSRVELLRLLGETHQLAGWGRFDRGELAGADASLESARRFAEAAGDAALVAYVLGPSHGFAATYAGRPALGLRRCETALEWARRSGNRRLIAFVLAIGARARARLGEASACLSMLDEADDELSRHRDDGQDPAWLTVFDAAAVRGHRGSCLLDLGLPGQAIDPLREQDAAAPQLFVRNRAIWLLDRADAYAALEEVDAACADIRQTFQTAAGTSSPRTMRRLAATVSRLDRWREVREVVEVRDMFRATRSGRPVVA